MKYMLGAVGNLYYLVDCTQDETVVFNSELKSLYRTDYRSAQIETRNHMVEVDTVSIVGTSSSNRCNVFYQGKNIHIGMLATEAFSLLRSLPRVNPRQFIMKYDEEDIVHIILPIKIGYASIETLSKLLRVNQKNWNICH